MNLLLDWTGFLRQSKGWWSNGGVPHQRETLDRTYRATMNHIKAGTGSPLAAADDGARHVTGMISLVTRPQSCQLYFFYGLAPSTWPHIFYFTSDTHTLSFNSTPPHLPSWLHTHIHTHTHTHTSLRHLGSDTRGTGLWQEIHTADRWALSSLTGGENRTSEGRRRRGRWRKWGRRWEERGKNGEEVVLACLQQHVWEHVCCSRWGGGKRGHDDECNKSISLITGAASTEWAGPGYKSRLLTFGSQHHRYWLSSVRLHCPVLNLKPQC